MALMRGMLFSGALFSGALFGEMKIPLSDQSASVGGKASDNPELLYREHWDYMDDLRAVQVQIADDRRGAVTVSIPLAAAVPDVILPPAMRSRIPVVRVADMLDDPLLLAAMAIIIDAATDDD